jgi:hypothetical protein
MFPVAAVASLYLAGCANQAVPLSVQGKSLSAHLQLKQKQVAYSDSYITDRRSVESGLGAAALGQFHPAPYIERGKYNVGTGSLSYQDHEYPFDVRGLGAAGIGAADIEAKGEVYGLERIRDFSGTYIRAAQYSVGGLWLRNENGVIIHIVEADVVPLFPAGDAVMINLKQ